jgi:uncharacterized membrane protein YeaQ/YmgE (transglycosylase-associated protein family)
MEFDYDLIGQWMRTGLEWIGFGTVVGLIAKAVLPGKDGGGALATVILGVVGSIVGAALLAFFVEGAHVTPISILGFFVALGGTTLLLIIYRILGGGSGVAPWFNFFKRTTTIKPKRVPTTTVVEETV